MYKTGPTDSIAPTGPSRGSASPVRRSVRGFTAIELLVTISLAAILLTLTTSGYIEFLDKRKIRGAVENIFADLQFARTEALKRSRSVRVVLTLSDGGATWCYGLTHNPSCDCTVTDITSAEFCSLDIDNDGDSSDIGSTETSYVVSNTQWPKVTISDANYPGAKPTLIFRPPHATATVGHIDITSDEGKSARIRTNEVGRVAICSPTDERLWDYESCS